MATGDLMISQLTAATTIASTDLLYYGKYPYGLTDDRAITYSNFKTQFAVTDTYSSLTTTDKTIIGALNELHQWDRVVIPTFYTAITPHTATDRIQVPTVTSVGAILYADTDGNKTITGTSNIFYTGAGIVLVTAGPYFKANQTGSNAASGLIWQNDGNLSSKIYHQNEVGASTLNIDALTTTHASSTINFGSLTTASSISYVFYNGIASYNSHPTFTADTEIVDKKYVDDAVGGENLWDRALYSGSVYYVVPHTAGDIVKIKSNIFLGLVDAFSRTQFWNYEANSVIRLGSLTSDGDSVDTTSEGSVFYGANAQGDAMASADFSYVRLKPNRIGLYNAKSAVFTGYLLKIDTITNECYLKDNAGNTTFNFDRATGIGTLYGIWSYNSHPTFSADTQLVDKKYVDDHSGAKIPFVESLTISSDGQTAFTLSHTPSTVAFAGLFLNGQRRVYSTDFTITGTSLTWNNPGSLTLKTTDSFVITYEY